MEKKEISTLFRQYYGRMYGMAVSILYDEQESKDVVSDIFERLLESDTVLWLRCGSPWIAHQIC